MCMNGVFLKIHCAMDESLTVGLIKGTDLVLILDYLKVVTTLENQLTFF